LPIWGTIYQFDIANLQHNMYDKTGPSCLHCWRPQQCSADCNAPQSFALASSFLISMPIFIWIGFVSFSQMNLMKAANKGLKVMVKTIKIEYADVYTEFSDNYSGFFDLELLVDFKCFHCCK
jgi:hypothetical protein